MINVVAKDLKFVPLRSSGMVGFVSEVREWCAKNPTATVIDVKVTESSKDVGGMIIYQETSLPQEGTKPEATNTSFFERLVNEQVRKEKKRYRHFTLIFGN